jgi:glycosyltransferase involved in cell wall biosynthesis
VSTSPLVSVVMPVYNGERFLREAVDSVLGQTYRELELVVVDDGSTDRTAEILASYGRADSRVVVQRQTQNQGVVAARNRAAELAQGKFIAMLDADDISVATRSERQVRHLQSHPEIGVLGGAVQTVDAEGRLGRVKRFPEPPALAAWLLLFVNTLANSATMLRREVREAVGWYSAEFAYGAEDYDFFARAARATRLSNLPDVVVHYRTWSGSMTQRSWERLENNATSIVRREASALLGRDVPSEDALSLRGLATDRYPTTPDAIRRLARLVDAVGKAVTEQPGADPSDRAAVRRDAAVKLWLLSTLAMRRSPGLGISLAAEASRLSPTSGGRFAAKVLRRLFSHA